MRKFLLFLASMLVLAACSNDDDSGDNLLRRKVEYPFAFEGAIVSRYHYDGYKLEDIEISGGRRKIYVYDGDWIVNVKTYSDVALKEEERYQYDTAGRLVQKQVLDFGSGNGERFTYTYNTDGTVIERRYDGNTLSQEDLQSVGTIHFENGLVKQIVYDAINGSGETSTVTYAYDDKLAPESNITGFPKLSLVQDGAAMHNMTWIERTWSNSSEIMSYNMEYSYNELGQATSFAYGNDGTYWVDGSGFTYFYD